MQLTINSYYSFSTRAPGILGSSFSNLKLASIMTFDLANKFINVMSMHANIYPVLPEGISDNPESYTYYLFKTESNGELILADVWIDQNTVIEKGSQSLVIEIPRVTNTDIIRINNTLNMMGYSHSSKIV